MMSLMVLALLYIRSVYMYVDRTLTVLSVAIYSCMSYTELKDHYNRLVAYISKGFSSRIMGVHCNMHMLDDNYNFNTDSH